MIHRHDDADPVENDPTGMRALLGSLPDPGPMPPDLVDRITARLVEESVANGYRVGPGDEAATAAAWAPPRVPGGPEGDDRSLPPAHAGGDQVVVPLRRRRAWLVGAAAAALVVVAAGGLVADRLAPDGLQASLGLARGGEDAGVAADAESGAAPMQSGSGMIAWDAAVQVVVVASGTDYTGDDLASQALPLDAGAMAPPSPGTGLVPRLDGADEPVGDPQGARDCASAVGVEASEPVAVDLATFDGRPAAVLVATGADGTRRAWAVERSCGPGAAALLDGPVVVG